MKYEGRHALLAFGIVLVVAAIAAGLFVLGTPAEERARRLDERRVQDLQQIQSAVNGYWTRNKQLPASLSEVTAVAGVRLDTRDPATGAEYGYAVKDSTNYELCAVFESQTEDSPSFWSHSPGRYCYTRVVSQSQD